MFISGKEIRVAVLRTLGETASEILVKKLSHLDGRGSV